VSFVVLNTREELKENGRKEGTQTKSIAAAYGYRVAAAVLCWFDVLREYGARRKKKEKLKGKARNED